MRHLAAIAGVPRYGRAGFRRQRIVVHPPGCTTIRYPHAGVTDGPLCSVCPRAGGGSLTTGVSEDPRQNFREAVSDRDSDVRSRGETPTRAPEERGIAIMKLTTMTQVTVDGVMQGNGP